MPVVVGATILAGIVIVIEWGIRRGTGRPAAFSDLRSISAEVSMHVICGAVFGSVISILGLLPGLGIAWLVIRDAGIPMLKLASPIAH